MTRVEAHVAAVKALHHRRPDIRCIDGQAAAPPSNRSKSTRSHSVRRNAAGLEYPVLCARTGHVGLARPDGLG